jgi:hypothetical protein
MARQRRAPCFLVSDRILNFVTGLLCLTIGFPFEKNWSEIVNQRGIFGFMVPLQ